jgi:hypothetical protein
MDGLTRILFFISEQTSLTNIYHRLKSRDNDCELYKDKIIKMITCNLNLSIPIILTFMFIIRSTIKEENFDSTLSFVVSLILALATMVSMRILSNPTNRKFKSKLISYFDNADERKEAIKIYKERMSSFFFSFICATIIIISVAFLYGIFKGYSNFSLMDLASTIISPTSLKISATDFLILFVCYTASLSIFTLIGEYILKRDIPLLQME